MLPDRQTWKLRPFQFCCCKWWCKYSRTNCWQGSIPNDTLM